MATDPEPDSIPGRPDVEFENPYFDEVAGGVTVGTNRGSLDGRSIEVYHRRQALAQTYAWAIPNHDAIATTVREAPVLEVGAGTGYWAWCVEQAGGEIVATDADPPKETFVQGRAATASEAVAWAADAMPDAALLLVWPPYDDPMAVNALDGFVGETVVYVGEGRGGCTGDDAFHEQLHREWRLAETVAIPTYFGMRDRLEVWRR